MLCFYVRVNNLSNAPSPSDSIEHCRPSFTVPRFVFDLFQTKCFPNICTTDRLFLFSLPLHAILISVLSKQIFIATFLIKVMPACLPPHPSTMNADVKRERKQLESVKNELKWRTITSIRRHVKDTNHADTNFTGFVLSNPLVCSLFISIVLIRSIK